MTFGACWHLSCPWTLRKMRDYDSEEINHNFFIASARHIISLGIIKRLYRILKLFEGNFIVFQYLIGKLKRRSFSIISHFRLTLNPKWVGCNVVHYIIGSDDVEFTIQIVKKLEPISRIARKESFVAWRVHRYQNCATTNRALIYRLGQVDVRWPIFVDLRFHFH